MKQLVKHSDRNGKNEIILGETETGMMHFTADGEPIILRQLLIYNNLKSDFNCNEESKSLGDLFYFASTTNGLRLKPLFSKISGHSDLTELYFQIGLGSHIDYDHFILDIYKFVKKIRGGEQT